MARRLSREEWAAARLLWEKDPQQFDSTIAEKFGVSKQAVTQRRNAENWQRIGTMHNVSERAHLLADATCRELASDKKKAQAIDEAVEIRARVIEKHRSDWKEHRNQFDIADIARDFELGKSAKITAEMIKIRQEGERKAYGLDEQSNGQNDDVQPVAITVQVKDARRD
jgi:hypothetical protein